MFLYSTNSKISIPKTPLPAFSNDFLHSNYRGNIKNEETYYDNLKLPQAPIFILSNIFALFPFKQVNPLRVHYFSLLFSFIVIMNILNFCRLRMKTIQKTEQSNTNILLYSGYSAMNAVFGITCIIAPVLYRQSMAIILKGFSKVDTIIYSLQSNYKFEEKPRRQYIQIIFTIGITSLFAFIYYKALYENRFPPFTYMEFYNLPVTSWIIFQMDYFQVHIRKRFAFVNSQLKSLLKERDDIDNNDEEAITDENTPPSIVNKYHPNQLNFIHFTLYKISSEINEAYSLQFLFMVPRVILFSVLPVHYNIVTALVSDSKDISGPQIWTHIFTISYTVLLTAPIIYVVSEASITVHKAKKINSLIHDLIEEGQEELIEYELLVCSIQLLHRKVEFSVKQFFSLKPSLTTAMFELIITYVIILLQFQDTLSSISPIRLLLRPVNNLNSLSNSNETYATFFNSENRTNTYNSSQN